MSASNNKQGFQFPKGPTTKLTPDEALQKHQANLAEMEKEMGELTQMINELDESVK